jgi:hypothetical protein
MASAVIQVHLDTRAAYAEHERLKVLAQTSLTVNAGLQMLFARGVQPFEMVHEPVQRPGAIAMRAQLSDPYWTLLESALTGVEW